MRDSPIPSGGVMSRTENVSAAGSAWTSKGPWERPRIPGIPPLLERSTCAPNWTNGGRADLKPRHCETTDPTQG